MWELVKDFLLVSMGMGIGVVLMCILSISKEADYEMKQLNEFRTKFVSMVFIKCTELSAYGDCGYRYLLRVQA
ncbi:TPA: DUF3789 domain-containing protein [Clostridioides difficile]|nr:DUF3789 domain-containing protein [Clostridioides difficile]